MTQTQITIMQIADVLGKRAEKITCKNGVMKKRKRKFFKKRPKIQLLRG